jgi:hypothetical protein
MFLLGCDTVPNVHSWTGCDTVPNVPSWTGCNTVPNVLSWLWHCPRCSFLFVALFQASLNPLICSVKINNIALHLIKCRQTFICSRVHSTWWAILWKSFKFLGKNIFLTGVLRVLGEQNCYPKSNFRGADMETRAMAPLSTIPPSPTIPKKDTNLTHVFVWP